MTDKAHILLLVSVIVGTIEVFVPHRLRMSVSDCQAGLHLPPFDWFRVLLRLPRPHEASSRLPRGPSLGVVEARGHVSGRSKRKDSPRIEEGAAKHRERSGFPSDYHTIFAFLACIYSVCFAALMGVFDGL